MNFKIFLALFIGLLAVNVSVQSPVNDDDFVKVVVEVLDKVLNVTGKLLDDANEDVDYVEKNQDKVVADVVTWASNLGKKVNALIIKLVDELGDGATDDGKAVIACIDAEQQKTEDAVAKVFGDIGGCAGPEIPQVIAEVKLILGQLGDLQDDVQGQTDTLGACTSGDLTCLLSFISTIVTTIKKIPDVAKQDITDIVALVKVIYNDVQSCADNVVAEIKSEAQAIFNEAVVCIKK